MALTLKGGLGTWGVKVFDDYEDEDDGLTFIHGEEGLMHLTGEDVDALTAYLVARRKS